MWHTAGGGGLLLLLTAGIGRGGGTCSPGQVPQPPSHSMWDPARSDAKCTRTGTFHACPNLPGIRCDWTHGGASCVYDDGSSSFCSCCCPHEYAGFTCAWQSPNWGAVRPGSLRAGETCTAVCQVGFVPSVPSAASEEFTCPGLGPMQPAAGSAFECITPDTRACTSSPPCEGDGCEWAAACSDPGVPNGGCEAQCRGGLVPANGLPDKVQYECKKMGQDWGWQPKNGAKRLQCFKVCPDVPPLLNQHWRTDDANDINQCGRPPYTHQSCKVGCNVGYEWAAGSSLDCLTDKDDNAGTCERKCCDCLESACGSARRQGKVACETCMEQGDKVSSCLIDGCTRPEMNSWCEERNDDRVGWYTCNIGGWTRDSAAQCQCTPKVCPAVSPAAHATACPVGHYMYGTNVCSVTCELGYEIVSGNKSYMCSARGNWESVGKPLDCKRTCEPQLPVLHSKPCQASDGREKPAEDEKCVGQCIKGYVVNRRIMYRCDDTGNWIQAVGNGEFTCVPDSQAGTCAEQTPAKNVHFMLQQTAECDRTKGGAVCKVECDEGWKSDGGDPFFLCDAGGRWVSQFPSNRLECREIPDRSPGSASSAWDWICGLTTIITVLSVPCIIQRFKKDLAAELSSPPLDLPEGEDALGWLGLIVFVIGVLDLALDISLCLALSSCGKWHLLASCLTSLVVTIGVTIHLGFSTLNKIREGNEEAERWWIKNGTAASLIVIVSASRIESLAILRLRLRGNVISDFPMSDEGFHFLKYEGSYHYILEDLPHLLAAIALLNTGDSCVENGVWIFSPGWIAYANIVHILWSIFYGYISKQGQKRIMRRGAARHMEEAVNLVRSLRSSLMGRSSADVEINAAELRGHGSE